MGWKQFVRQAQAASRRRERESRAAERRSEREAMRRHRELVRELKESAREQAAEAAEEYENYVAMLVSVHTDCSEPWDWRVVSVTPPPREPKRTSAREAAARAQLDAYAPGAFERWFGGAKKQRALLEQAVQQGAAADQQEYEAAMAVHRKKLEHWEYQVGLAPGVLKLDLEACRAALRYIGSFDELEEFSTRVSLDSIAENVATFTCQIEDSEIVPTEEVKLTATGKLSSKEMAVGKYWALYQDHVASCAIRVARESYAVIPVDRVIVNVRAVRLDSRTGHMSPQNILAVHFVRGSLQRLNLQAIDPSDSLKNFPHRMKFKKTAGFDQIEAMTADEQWVAT